MKKILLALLLLLSVVASAQRPGRDYAVFFYVTDFQPRWASLPETKTEALALKKELETNFGFTCEAVPNPSKQTILDKIRSYNDLLTANDQVMFFFSMHGHFEDVAERGYLVAADGLEDDEYGASYLSYDDLSAYLARCKAKHVLLALDACHSGAFGTRNRPRPDAPAYAQADNCQQRISKMFQYSGRQYCSSGNKAAKTPTKSLFAARLLEALRTGGEEGLVRFADLEYYLSKVDNPKPESGSFKGHDPGGDFVFVRKNGCATQTAPSVNSAADQDKAQWRQAEAAKTLAAYRQYLRDCGLCLYTEEAEAAITRLKTATPVDRGPDLPIEAVKSGDLMPDGMVFVKGGTFQMGSPNTEADRSSDDEQHEVELSDFYIGKYEIIQKQWREVMGDNPSYFKDCDNCPVEQISWNDIQEFIQKLNQQTGQTYRLPTEAEWEYAARGGGNDVFFGNGKNIADPKEINFNGSEPYKNKYSVTEEYRQKTIPVGSLIVPNALGLHDMSGNVYEWCSDWYDSDYYKNCPPKNPTGPTNGSYRVIRGGSWGNDAQACRTINRDSDAPGSRNYSVGFRLAKTN